MKILSLSSSVAHGHVGNSALVPPLQRLGFDVTAIHTVQFSNHPGHGGFGGDVFPADHVGRVVDGLAAGGFLSGHDGVLSGYLGDAGNGPALMRMLAANPDAPYLCDPVMGDDGRLYVRSGIAEFLRTTALPAATIVTPNPTELGVLAGTPADGPEQCLAAAASLLARGPRLVVVTSLWVGDDMACAAVTAEGRWLVRTPRLTFAHPINGAGDLLAGLVLAEHLNGADAPALLAGAVSRLFAVLEATQAGGGRELAVVAAQDRLVRPPRRFVAEQS